MEDDSVGRLFSVGASSSAEDGSAVRSMSCRDFEERVEDGFLCETRYEAPIGIEGRRTRECGAGGEDNATDKALHGPTEAIDDGENAVTAGAKNCDAMKTAHMEATAARW